MMSFRGGRLGEMPLPPATVWLLGDVLEGKGRQALFVKQAPQVLKALRDVALVESAESSNRIEGVTVERARLRPLVLGNARPRDRSEREVQGYRNGLNLIHTAADRLPVAPDTLCNFRRLIQEDSGDAGEWKKVENEIIEIRAGAPQPARSKAGTRQACGGGHDRRIQPDRPRARVPWRQPRHDQAGPARTAGRGNIEVQGPRPRCRVGACPAGRGRTLEKEVIPS